MTLTTRTTAKGIPPRVRSPAGKGKKKVAVVKAKEKRKRDEEENSDSPKSKKKRKKTTKQCSKNLEALDEEESEVELVEDDAPVPDDVVVIDDGPSALGDKEVSKVANRLIYPWFVLTIV